MKGPQGVLMWNPQGLAGLYVHWCTLSFHQYA